MTEPNTNPDHLALRCYWCKEAMIFHTRFTIRWHKLLTRLASIPTTYVATLTERRAVERIDTINTEAALMIWPQTMKPIGDWYPAPIEPEEMRKMKQGPCMGGGLNDVPYTLNPSIPLRSPLGFNLQNESAYYVDGPVAYPKQTLSTPAWALPTVEQNQAWVRLLIDVREAHESCHDHTLGADDAKLGDTRCDLCKGFDAIPTHMINAFLKEGK